MNYKHEFLDYSISNISMNEIISEIINISKMDFKRLVNIFVINANKIYLMDKDKELNNICNNSDFVISEMAIVIGSRWLNNPIKERVSGVELMGKILEISADHRINMYFLGAKQKTIDLLVKNVSKNYHGCHVVGSKNGYFEDSNEIISEINKCNVDVLFVAMGSPKQEVWIEKNRNKLNAKIAIGVGGSFDVYSGEKKPAPKWTKHGFEWIYRTFQDPKTYLKRYLITNTYFLLKIIKFKLNLNKGD